MKCENLIDFDKSQIVIARQLGQVSPYWQILWGVRGMQWLIPAESGTIKKVPENIFCVWGYVVPDRC